MGGVGQGDGADGVDAQVVAIRRGHVRPQRPHDALDAIPGRLVDCLARGVLGTGAGGGREKQDGAVGVRAAVVAKVDAGDAGDIQRCNEVDIDDLAVGALLSSVHGRCNWNSRTYLSHGVQGQSVVERITHVVNVGRGDHGVDHVVNPLVALKSAVEQAQDGLVIGHIDWTENGAWRHGHPRLGDGRPHLATLVAQLLAGVTVNIPNDDISTTLAAQLGQTRAGAIGRACFR